MQRRGFLRGGAVAAGLSVFGQFSPAFAKTITTSKSLILRFKPYTLGLKHAFNLASSSRTTTPVVLTEIEYDGVIGYGEASMPPYLGESHETVTTFLAKVDLNQFKNPFEVEEILHYVDLVAAGNTAAKASVDIALHDLVGKLIGKPLHRIWGYNPKLAPPTSLTIGIDTPEVVKAKTKETKGFKIVKIKLGRGTDKEMVEAVRSVTKVPISVDINQGWKDRSEALDMCHWLKDQGCVLIEQPLAKDRIDDLAWLTEKSPLPIIGDEGVQRLVDVRKAWGVYSGINVKLMKCTGLREAQKMLITARSLGMKLMIGCMTETSCAISAAAQLSTLVDWADLDGALLINNDVFNGITVENGQIMLKELPGIGVTKKAV